jgi:hypothetical protein
MRRGAANENLPPLQSMVKLTSFAPADMESEALNAGEIAALSIR